MKRKVITTKDGSKTIHLEDWNESYHSTHGAIQEAQHVYIRQGFKKSGLQNIAILEFGFGTGLNAIITFLEAKTLPKSIKYTALEAYPVSKKELEELNYLESLNDDSLNKVYKLMHDSPWEEFISLSNKFTLKKLRMDFRELAEVNQYDIVYYDAFGPRVQPELWTREIFAKVFLAMKENGILVTYSCKGSVRRALLECGFKVEKLPGPPGKREMLRAYKPITGLKC